MIVKKLPVTPARIREFLMLSERGISWPADIGQTLANDDLDRMDVLHVLKSAEVDECLNGKNDGRQMVTTGQTCDGAAIMIKYRIDPFSFDIIVESVSRV